MDCALLFAKFTLSEAASGFDFVHGSVLLAIQFMQLLLGCPQLRIG
jgi:hypothetical protein